MDGIVAKKNFHMIVSDRSSTRNVKVLHRRMSLNDTITHGSNSIGLFLCGVCFAVFGAYYAPTCEVFAGTALMEAH